MLSAAGIPQNEAAKISLACRGFSSVSAVELRRRIDWLMRELDLDGGKKGASTSSGNNSADNADDFDIVTGGSSGIARENLRKLLSKWPRALDCDPTKALAPRTAYFRSIGLLPADLRRLALRAPQLLGGLSLRGVIMPRVEALRKSAALDGAGVSRVVARAPTVLLAAPSAVAERARLVADRCSLDRRQLARAVAGHPALLEYSVDSLSQRLDFLRNETGLRPPELGDVLSRAPSLLSLDVERNLRPKWRFLVKTTKQTAAEGNGSKDASNADGGSEEGARKLLARCPVYLTLSLERRILPRVAFLEAVRAQREGGRDGKKAAKRDLKAAGGDAAAGKEEHDVAFSRLPLPPMVVALASAAAGLEFSVARTAPSSKAKKKAAERVENSVEEKKVKSSSSSSVLPVSYLTWSDAMFAERGARTPLSEYEEFKERVVAALAGVGGSDSVSGSASSATTAASFVP